MHRQAVILTIALGAAAVVALTGATFAGKGLSVRPARRPCPSSRTRPSRAG